MSLIELEDGPGEYLSLWPWRLPDPPPIGDPKPEGGLRALRQHVEAAHGLQPGAILSLSCVRPIAWARQEFMWRARQYRWPDRSGQFSYRYSLPMIGAYLHRDHTTVLFGVRAHAKRLKEAEAGEG